MRIALAQTNPTVGDIAHNARRIIEFANRTKAERTRWPFFPSYAFRDIRPKTCC